MTVVRPDMAAGAGGSPVGDTVEWHVRERQERSRRDRDTLDRDRPFEEVARAVIMRRAHLEWTEQHLAHRMGTTTSVIAHRERAAPE